jgi:hypothetical protein
VSSLSKSAFVPRANPGFGPDLWAGERHRGAAALWQLHGRTAWPLPCFSRQEYADVVASPLAALGGPWLLHCIFLIT